MYIVLVIAIFIVAQLVRSKQYDWSITFAHQDDNPYGTLALQTLLTKSGYAVRNTYQTLYELKDSLHQETAIVILATSFSAAKEDVDVLLNHVAQGGEALIAANYFYQALADTLGLSCRDNLFNDGNLLNGKDTSTLHLVNTSFDTAQTFPFRRDHIYSFFKKVDSVKATVLLKNQMDQPTMVRIAHGKGFLFLLSTPMIFTNIHVMSKGNHELPAGIFSFLKSTVLLRTEYYHLGRMEAATPLRFVLTSEPLRWAYYMTIISLLLFMIFESKRKQRIIPILRPLANTTLEFVATIGNLYLQRGDHKNIAEKKIQFFWDQVRTHYYIQAHQGTSQVVSLLAKKSGKSEEDVQALLKQFDQVHHSKQVHPSQLLGLTEAISKFWKK